MEAIKERTQALAPIVKGSCQPSKARMTEGLKATIKFKCDKGNNPSDAAALLLRPTFFSVQKGGRVLGLITVGLVKVHKHYLTSIIPTAVLTMPAINAAGTACLVLVTPTAPK